MTSVVTTLTITAAPGENNPVILIRQICCSILWAALILLLLYLQGKLETGIRFCRVFFELGARIWFRIGLPRRPWVRTFCIVSATGMIAGILIAAFTGLMKPELPRDGEFWMVFKAFFVFLVWPVLPEELAFRVLLIRRQEDPDKPDKAPDEKEVELSRGEDKDAGSSFEIKEGSSPKEAAAERRSCCEYIFLPIPISERLLHVAIFVVWHLSLYHPESIFYDWRFLITCATMAVLLEELLVRTRCLWLCLFTHTVWLWFWIFFGGGRHYFNA